MKVLTAGAQLIRLELGCKADPQFYDLPLTLLTRESGVRSGAATGTTSPQNLEIGQADLQREAQLTL